MCRHRGLGVWGMGMMVSKSASFRMWIAGQYRQLLCHVHGLCVLKFCSNPTISVTKSSRYKARFSLGPW